jgi:alpha-tubulin suppressor-like RCC1 family protein
VPVSGGLIFATLSAGNRHTCGVTNAGAAYCWGDNSNGNLGNGTNFPASVPVAVSGGLTFSTISAGRFHTCGVTTGGLAYCWGGVALGNGTTGSSLVPVAVR